MFELMPFTKSMMNPFYEMDKMTRNFFGDTSLQTFRTDVQDNGDRYTLEAELPGFQKEDIHIDVEGDRLTIQAEHKSEDSQQDDQGNYLRRERYYGSYSRSFDISQIAEDQISAAYENGILKLELPKTTVVSPTSRRLEIQ